MSTIFKFKLIANPIKDISGERIETGYELFIPYSVFENFGFSAKMKLYCPSCNFFDTAMMLHAWFVTKEGIIAKKETDILSVEWVQLRKFIQPNVLYWPNVQEVDIPMYKYDMLFVVQPLIDIAIDELFLELEADTPNL